jgi:hypothetical protein
LTLENFRSQYLFCDAVADGLEKDADFFLKVQLKWLGMDYSPTWLEKSSISVSLAEIDNVTDTLKELYCSGGVLDKNHFDILKQTLIGVAAKIEPKKFKGKAGNLTTVNNVFALRSEWSDYKIVSDGDDTTFYEILFQGKSRNCIQESLTSEKLKEIVENANTDDFCVIFQSLFAEKVPECLADDVESLKVYMNRKLASHQGLQGEILRRSSGKKIGISKNPRRAKAVQTD